MNTCKYREGMDYNQFLYANYGFYHTREQRSRANVDYLRLKYPKLTTGSDTTNS